jgi:hypothetical protein
MTQFQLTFDAIEKAIAQIEAKRAAGKTRAASA